jgi:hypothetical protein
MWVLVILAVALYFAAKAGIPAAGRAIGEAWHNRGDNGRIWAEKRAARKQLTSDAVDSGMAPVSTKVGGVTGVATGAVITGSRLAVAAFLRACKEGWGEGKARAKAWQAETRRAENAGSGDDEDGRGGHADCIATFVRGGDIVTCGKPTVRKSPYCQPHWDAWNTTEDPDGGVVHSKCRTCGQLPMPALDQCFECIAAEGEAKRANSCQSCGKSLEGEEISGRRPGWCCACTAKYVPGCIGEVWLSESDTYAQCNAQTVPGSPYCRGHLDETEAEPAVPTPAPITTEGTSTMPIESTGTGEIVSYDQFIAELDAARTEARSEIDEAKVQEKVAKANLQRAEVMANALTRLNLPKEVVDAVKKTKDSLNSQVKACEGRIAAAELAVAQLSIAMTAATNNPQQQFYRG